MFPRNILANHYVQLFNLFDGEMFSLYGKKKKKKK